MPTAAPARGEIWLIDFDPTRGHEQSGTRPALVISVDIFNAGPAGLLIVCPITSVAKGIRSHVPIAPPEGGLTMASYVKCEDVRSVTTERIVRKFGRVTASTMSEVEARLRMLMGL
jgi:mRNA interferase MazF